MKYVLVVAIFLLAPAAAHAQVAFPVETAWVPLRCDDDPMSDPFQDQAGAIDERDIVGDATGPAGWRASDDTNLFLRMRLDQDPAPNGNVRSFAWGMQFDLDGNLQNYELMILSDGVAGMAGQVSVFANTMTTQLNSLDDPADQPPEATFVFADNARTAVAAGTTFGDDDDFFLEMGIPWTTVIPLGLDRDTPTFVWVATSSSANSLNGDVACHDGASGAATLDGTASDETTGDPAEDPDGGVGAGRLEGGGGCDVGSGSGLLVALALVRLRRRRG